MGLLMDSTVLIHAERSSRTVEQLIQDIMDRFGDIDLALSAMSAAELFHGCWRADSPQRRARREEFVESVLSVIPTAPVTLEVARVFAEVDAKLRAAGDRIATSDLLIGATALVRGDELATGNLRHFERIPGLVIREF